MCGEREYFERVSSACINADHHCNQTPPKTSAMRPAEDAASIVCGSSVEASGSGGIANVIGAVQLEGSYLPVATTGGARAVQWMQPRAGKGAPV